MGDSLYARYGAWTENSEHETNWSDNKRTVADSSDQQAADSTVLYSRLDCEKGKENTTRLHSKENAILKERESKHCYVCQNERMIKKKSGSKCAKTHLCGTQVQGNGNITPKVQGKTTRSSENDGSNTLNKFPSNTKMSAQKDKPRKKVRKP